MEDPILNIEPVSPLQSLETATAVHLLRKRSLEDALPLVVEEIGRQTGAEKVLLYLTDPEYMRPDNDEGWKIAGSWADDRVGLPGGWEESRMLSAFYRTVFRGEAVEPAAVYLDQSAGVELEFLQALGVSALLVIPFAEANGVNGLLLVASMQGAGWGEDLLDGLMAAGALIGTAAGHQRTIYQLKNRSRSFLRLNTLTRTALERSDLTGMLEILSMELMEMLSADWGHIFLYHSHLVRQIQPGYEHTGRDLFTIGDEQEMLPQLIRGLQNIKAFPGIEIAALGKNRWIEVPVGEGTLLTLPLVDGSERYGLVALQFTRMRHFTIEEIALCDQAVKQIALGMTRAALMLKLENQVEKRTQNLAEAVDQMRRENSERSQAERQLRASEERLRSVTESAPLGIIMLNEKGIIQFWNPAAERIFGFPGEEVKGAPLSKILSPDSHREFWNYVDEKFAVGSRVGSEALALEGISASGNVIALEISTGVWRQEQEHFYSLLVRDASQEREIRRWAERQGQFAFVGKVASGVAQDFSTILSAIILYAELLANFPELSERGRNYVEMILQQSRRAASLSTQILDIENTSSEVQKPLDLVPFLGKISTLLERTFLEHNAISLVHGNEDYTISVDENRLRQVVLDLAFHLRDFLSEGDSIEIRLDRNHVSLNTHNSLSLEPGEWVGLRLSAKEVEPGSTGRKGSDESAYNSNRDDMGLGFPQLVSMVERQNGVLDREVTSEGKPLFTLYFPALNISEDLEEYQKPESSVPQQVPVILVVEDEAASREAVCEVLESQGYQVLQAENGKIALDQLHSHTVNLIITDIIMPEMGGIALINQVHKEYGQFEILIMSGYPLGEGPGELLNSEGVRWLKKPISTTTLIRATAEALSRQVSAPQTSGKKHSEGSPD